MKKLTLQIGWTMFCLILLCIVSLQSCRKETILPSKGSNSLTIAEAKSYFESNFKNKLNFKGKTMSLSDGNPSMTYESLMANKQALWDKAYQKMISVGGAVKVPLDFGNARKIVDNSTKASVPFAALNYLLLYKDSLNNVHTEWVYLQPTLEWLNGDRAVYKGRITIKDWNGKFIKEYTYGQINHTNNSHELSNGKIMAGGSVQPELVDGCLIWPVKEKCACLAAWASGYRMNGNWDPSKCDYCDRCVDYWCMPEPECDTCPPQPDPGGGTGGNGNGSGNTGSGYPPPGHNGGGGGTGPGDYNPSCTDGPQVVNTDGSMTPEPCIPPPFYPPNPYTAALQSFIMELEITDGNIVSFLAENALVFNALNAYLDTNGHTTENKDFVKWAVEYLNENRSLNFNAFFVEFFLSRPEVIADPNADNWTDPDNEVLTDLDQTVYQQYQDNQPWPTIKREDVITFEKFVPLRKDANGHQVNCLILAKEQLGKVGYTCSGYLPGTQTFSIYTSQNGVNLTQTKKAISYLISSLSQKIPVLIGVDNRSGAPTANLDNTTDHFVVIVGMGTDADGKYFQFVDSATDIPRMGASWSNRLYYDSSTGKITGKTGAVGYRSLPGMRDYTVTQVRKSIKK